ncbi:hypothetical protein [Chelatococcus asaccharovorans]|nr:hypothetical protein [Chelatococcus asaccharovorans]
MIHKILIYIIFALFWAAFAAPPAVTRMTITADQDLPMIEHCGDCAASLRPALAPRPSRMAQEIPLSSPGFSPKSDYPNFGY